MNTPQALIAQALADGLPKHWKHLSDASIGQCLASFVHAGIEGAAAHAHFVPTDPIADAVWSGARILRQEANRR